MTIKLKKLFAAIPALLCSLAAPAVLTIEDCVADAEANYPLIKRYALVESTAEIDLSEINKSWLPHLTLYGQGTVQNVVPKFPGTLSDVLEKMGQSMKGLDKFQYKAGVDVSQNVWDGGMSRARRELTRAEESVSRSSLDVELYTVRQRVESLFFAILLTEEQIAQSEITCRLLESNLQRLGAMCRNGVAMQSDVDMVEAQLLTVTQNIEQARSAAEAYRKMLGIFIGKDVADEELILPSAEEPLTESGTRPELKLFESREAAAGAALKLQERAHIPRVGFFVQANYGYPGFDYFKSMMNRNPSFNILSGVKLTWNIDSFYSRRNNRCRYKVNTLEIESQRDLFLFNNSLQATSQRHAIDGLRQVMTRDVRIIELRGNVRRAAESQLENGIIDATALLSKISDENMARLNGKLHEIQYIKEIYNLKYTLNR